MHYSIDLRQRVVDFVRGGGSKAEPSRRFKVSLWCVFDWLKRGDLSPQKVTRRHRKLDWEALRVHVQAYPDACLKERFEHFQGHIHAIWYALRRMKLTYKKTLKYAERSPQARLFYLNKLKHLLILFAFFGKIFLISNQ